MMTSSSWTRRRPKDAKTVLISRTFLLADDHEKQEPRRRSRSHGFTLIETLLATSLFLLLVGASIMSMEPASRGTKLIRRGPLGKHPPICPCRGGQHGTASSGLDPQDVAAEPNEPNQIRVSWEPEPLNEPDVFQDLSCAKWEMDDFSECASVEQVSVTTQQVPELLKPPPTSGRRSLPT